MTSQTSQAKQISVDQATELCNEASMMKMIRGGMKKLASSSFLAGLWGIVEGERREVSSESLESQSSSREERLPFGRKFQILSILFSF